MAALGGGTGNYVLYTFTNSVTTGDRVRDSRDIMAAASANGTTWPLPVRVNDDPGWFHNWLPEVAVPSDGNPYVMWYDWRDDAACGGSSHIYTSRSLDAGATWAGNQRLSTVQTAWTTVQSNIAPNQGDYNGMHGAADALYTWADGRNGDPDVFMARLPTSYTVGCPGAQVTAANGNLSLSFPVANLNNLFSGSYNYSLTSPRNWPGLPANGNTLVAAEGTNNIQFDIPVPDTAAAGVFQMCFAATQPNNSVSHNCCFNVTVDNTLVGIGPSGFRLALEQSRPNPARGGAPASIAFSLPASGRATLRVYGARGERVRTLVDGELPPGPGTATWNLLDEAGRAVPSGIYYYRLEFAGQHLQRHVTVIR
jgi:hypothetical protein